MALKPDPEMGINSWLEDELYHQYLRDRSAVDESWKEIFEKTNGAPAKPVAVAPAPTDSNGLQPLRGVAGRIAENMSASLTIPLATSQRTIAVKVMDENRRIINEHRSLLARGKVSFTHIIGWAIVKALEEFPAINQAYAERDGQPFRAMHPEINLGIAIDVAGKDGGRSLMAPNIKNAGSLNFAEYVNAFDDLVARARRGKLTPADFERTTISLTNPGTVGTLSSNPRLMPGQGAIIASGAIDYPAEYRGAAAETRAVLGISKVMSLSCTYDHRIIQGAESGAFLGKLQDLLDGKDSFYEEIFEHLRMPHQPVHWEVDRQPLLPGMTGARHAEIAKQAAIMQLINAFRVRGHLIADLDPLGAEPAFHPELQPETYGLTMWDLDREFLTGPLGENVREGGPKPVATLREILETLRKTYCGKIGCEYMNIQVPAQKHWLQQRMEPQANQWKLDVDTRVRALRNLIAAEEFEHFLHSRFVGQKRFALEGGETALAILEEILHRAASNDVAEVVMGMAHRGRLNVLANTVGKDVKQIFSEFEGEIDPSSTQGSGDVKYHLGATGVREIEGRQITVSLSPNPSHLEAVDPVVEGLVRPKQDRLGDTERERVIPILIHGDAAFAGQGVVAETLNLSQLVGNTTDVFVTSGSHTLNAFPYPGWVFYGFVVNGLTPAYLSTVNVTTPLNIIPEFSVAKRVDFLTNPLGLQVLVDGGAINTPAPPLAGVNGVTCAPDYSRLPPNAPAGFTPLCFGQFDFLPGSVHHIGAPTPQQDSASNYWVFSSFSNGLGQNATYTAGTNVNTPDILTANFIPGVHVTISTNPGGLKVMIDGRDNWPGYTFVWGQAETHSLNAESPQTDSHGRTWVFTSWSDAGAQAHSITVPAAPSTGLILMANYTELPQVTINSTPAGLTFNIDGSPCTTPCVVNRASGSQMTVTIPGSIPATQASRYDFLAWADGNTGTSRQVSFSQDTLTLTANYQTSYLLTTATNPANSGTFKTVPPSPDGYFPSGTQISVTEVPNGGFKFVHWDGDLSGTFGSGALTMSTPHSVIADFVSVPYIPPAGIQSAAGPTTDGSVAAGSIIAIYGQNLASAFQLGPSNPLAQAIGTTTITVGTFILPLVYVSPTLISAQVPWEITPGSYTLTVHNTGQPDVPGTITVSRNSPAVFTQQNTQNLPLVLALHADGSLVSFTSPAIRGEQITIYATGLGPYDHNSVDAFPAGTTPTFDLLDPIVVTSDSGQQWQPDWAGAAPGIVGVAEVKLTITNDMPSAANLNFQLLVNSKLSPQAVLPLQ